MTPQQARGWALAARLSAGERRARWHLRFLRLLLLAIAAVVVLLLAQREPKDFPCDCETWDEPGGGW